MRRATKLLLILAACALLAGLFLGACSAPLPTGDTRQHEIVVEFTYADGRLVKTDGVVECQHVGAQVPDCHLLRFASRDAAEAALPQIVADFKKTLGPKYDSGQWRIYVRPVPNEIEGAI